jgi:predicted DNA-binding protein YlxM (UPF0122 family)
MIKNVERLRKQKLASYYRSQARKKTYLKNERKFEFLEDFPTWEIDKFRIPEKYRIIIESYYGLDTNKMSLREIGVELGISKQAVHELRDKTLSRLGFLSKEFNLLVEFPNWTQDKFKIPKNCKKVLEYYFGINTPKLSTEEIELKLKIDKNDVQTLRGHGLTLLMYFYILNFFPSDINLNINDENVLQQVKHKTGISIHLIEEFLSKGKNLLTHLSIE